MPKIHRSYSVFEAADLLGVCRATIRRWNKQGLRPLDDTQPVLFLGSELKSFLERRKANARASCGPGRLYCFKCRAARRPALGMVELKLSEGAAGNLTALCETCGTVMNRRCAAERVALVMPGLEVTVRGG